MAALLALAVSGFRECFLVVGSNLILNRTFRGDILGFVFFLGPTSQRFGFVFHFGESFTLIPTPEKLSKDKMLDGRAPWISIAGSLNPKTVI